MSFSPSSRSLSSRIILAAVLCLSLTAAFAGNGDWRSPANLKRLGATAIETQCRLLKTSRLGALYYPGEPVSITIAMPAAMADTKGLTVQAVPIHTRTEVPGETGYVENGAPQIQIITGVEINPTPVLPAQAVDGKIDLTLLIPDTYGTYALLLVNGNARSLIGAVARVHQPVPRKGDIPQIMGEMNMAVANGEPMAIIFSRLGIGLIRVEMHWNTPGNGQPNDFRRLQEVLDPCAKHGIKVMQTVGAHPFWSLPMGQPTPAVDGQMPDFVSARKYDDQFARWVREYVAACFTGGDSGLWALEHWNEPWEPLSISGWQSDSVRYREILALLIKNAKAANPKIKIATACSIMNTEDKLLSDGNAERVVGVDIFTDHYVVPRAAYGPLVAAKYGKISGETETWGAATELLLLQFMTQFMAVGQKFINPTFGEMLMINMSTGRDIIPGPAPTAVAVSAWNAMIADRPFSRIAFHDHLPWLFQFGPDDDARFVLIGRLPPIATGDANDVLWKQAYQGPDGTMQLADPDGALEVCDAAGNLIPPDGTHGYDLIMSPTPYFLRSTRGAAHLVQAVARPGCRASATWRSFRNHCCRQTARRPSPFRFTISTTNRCRASLPYVHCGAEPPTRNRSHSPSLPAGLRR